MTKKAADQSPLRLTAEPPEARASEVERSSKPDARPHLTAEQCRTLLVPHEVVRDPVHQDIAITALERRIIDTRDFQRLRSIKQLGPTDLVYPGAVHTRFLHSLGTLHCAEQMIQYVNKNARIYRLGSLLSVEEYPHVLIRLCALLHDIAHIPYGHTLEDEGNLADPEWEDAERATRLLGARSDITTAITEFLGELGIERDVITAFLNDVCTYIRFKGDPAELEFPFVVDIVGNTLCADLVDYADRDMYFAGLRERAGDRVLKYLAIVKAVPSASGASRSFDEAPSDRSAKGRVVLLAYRYEQEHRGGSEHRKLVSKLEILSEAIDILRRRFALAEKVFFHRTKLVAAAMLISAVNSSSSVRLRDLYFMSDDALLNRLADDPDERPRRLARAYLARGLYKPVFRLDFRPERDGDRESELLWREKYPKLRDPKWRGQVEHRIERLANLPAGSVAVYCPDREMNIKEFEMLVQASPKSPIRPLSEILDPKRKAEMAALNGRFEELWKCLIVVDPKALDVGEVSRPEVQDLGKLCEDVIGLPNDISDLRGKGRRLGEQVAGRVTRKFEGETGQEVPSKVYQEIVDAEHRIDGDRDPVEIAEAHLRMAMTSRGPK